MPPAHDDETLAWYNREAPVYARRREPSRNERLEAFLARLKPGASILELGCGGGQDAEVMIAAGFDVDPTDGSVGLAAEAERRLNRPVRIMRFEDLDAVERYDAVWANACLLHVPEAALADVMARVWRALKPGGVFFASFKSGDGGDRDTFGRYYNFVSRAGLEAAYAQSGAWSELTLTETPGGGYDGVPRTWLMGLAVKGG
jgi:SAM-dependent methyltransferase